ncbi:MAG: type II toxin-antitoxin system Phd/YefM family antitoxin [Methanomassiliicoccaceae archaeon]|nr:type II toxin-antitoxin system Phd/YefM family antitoxin [Methanomassiliicoccaceae archaeon]
MPTINAAEARSDLNNVIKAALDEPVRITSEEGTVIMLSEKEWEDVLETIYIMGVPGLVDEIKENRKLPRSEFIRWNDIAR